MQTATHLRKQIARWDLQTIDQYVVERPSEDPDDDVVRVVMVRRNTGVRSNRFRNRRVFFITGRELMKVNRGAFHPRYPLTPDSKLPGLENGS